MQRVRGCKKAAAGKGGILASWYGVYACPAKDGTGEFTSFKSLWQRGAGPASHHRGAPSSPPLCWKQCGGGGGDIPRTGAHLRRRLVPA